MLKFRSRVLFAAGSVRENIRHIFAASLGKVGGSAGFVTRAANNTDLVTCPASQTAAKYVIPLHGLTVGNIITGFHLIGQIESGGNAVTVDVDLRKMTAAAADPVDASIATMTQLSVTAQTAMTSANTSKSGLSEVIAADTSYYALITATTLGSTDIALQGIVLISKSQ